MSKQVPECAASGAGASSGSLEADRKARGAVTLPSRSGALPTAQTNFLQRLAATTLIAAAIPLANAFDPISCCMLRARELVSQLNNTPWTVCSAGVVDPWNSAAQPRVTADLSWCLSNCQGFVASGLGDWLHPLLQWFAPYFSLLFLCPIGKGFEEDTDRSISMLFMDFILHQAFKWVAKAAGLDTKGADDGEKENDGKKADADKKKAHDGKKADADKKKAHADKIPPSSFTQRVLEWGNLLGDPASAIWGGISQLNMDTWIVNRLRKRHKLEQEPGGETKQKPKTSPIHWYEKEMLGVAVMASQTPMNSRLGDSLTKELIIKGLETATEVAFPTPKTPKVKGKRISPLPPPESIIQLKKALSAAPNVSAFDQIEREVMRKLAKYMRDLMMGHISFGGCLKNIKEAIQPAPSLPPLPPNSLDAAICAVVEDLDQRNLFPDPDIIPAPGPENPYLYDESTFATSLRKGIRTILEGRMPFITAVALPVVIHFATTAQVFYEAYQKLGDSSTAHSLSYGALYSWLLLVAVIGNCSVASANAGLVTQQIKEIFTLSGSRVPLRNRYSNSVEWECWLTDIGVQTGLRRDMEPIDDKSNNAEKKPDTNVVASGDPEKNPSPNIEALKDPEKKLETNEEASKYAFRKKFYVKYILGQIVGWICVAFVCGCAATISYQTPTVGWGCRSFNQLLYIILSLVVALLGVFRHWVEKLDYRKQEQQFKELAKIANGEQNQDPPDLPEVIKADQNQEATSNSQEAAAEKKNEPTPPPWLKPRHPHPPTSFGVRLVQVIYAIFVLINIFVLVGGTIFHFAGLYTSCRCASIFGSLDSEIDLAGSTQLDRDLAQQYWNSSGYVAYLFAWCVCAIAVVVRKFLHVKLDVEFPGEEADKKRIKAEHLKELEDAAAQVGKTAWGYIEKDNSGTINDLKNAGEGAISALLTSS